MTTKQRILQAALAMFSSKGYGAVSIRDIAYSVGIKESTIYYHFQNKQDIIDQLLSVMEEEMERKKRRFLSRLDGIREVTEEEFVKVALHYRHSFYEAEPFAQFIAMLSIERYANAQAAALYQKLLFAVPLEHQERVFRIMHERGIIKNGDADALAKEYHYIVLGAFMNGINDQALSKLIQRFYRREMENSKPNFGTGVFNEDIQK